MRVRLLNALLVVLLLAASPSAYAAERAQQNDPRYFSETGFRISNDKFWDFFQHRDGPARLLPLLNLQSWGAPPSKPMRDPKTNTFVSLRFQRGIMHYDDGCKCTQGLLLGDYLKALITGENLPADLEAQAAKSPLL